MAHWEHVFLECANAFKMLTLIQLEPAPVYLVSQVLLVKQVSNSLTPLMTGLIRIEKKKVAQSLSPGIDTGEFPFHTPVFGGSVDLHWRIDQDTITIGLTSSTVGWIGFGIGEGMEDADIVMGYVDSNGPHVKDCHATQQAGLTYK